MDRTAIPLDDAERWRNWVDCAAAMVDELRLLSDPAVHAVLNRYECRRVDYGMGLNVDWPKGDPRAVSGLDLHKPVQMPADL